MGSKTKQRYAEGGRPTERFTVDLEGLRHCVKFRLNISQEEMEKELIESGARVEDLPDFDDADSTICTIEDSKGRTMTFIWIKEFKNDLRSKEILASETYRIAMAMLSRFGHPKEDLLKKIYADIFFTALRRTTLSE